MSRQNRQSAQGRGGEKAQDLGQDNKPSKALALGLVLAAVALAAGVAWWSMEGPAQPLAPAPAPEAARVQAGEKVAAFPAKMFDDGKARHFEHRLASGVTVRYFILKSPDGVIRAAYDACELCWSHGKGYYQDGGDMVCASCDRRLPSGKVDLVQGGCNPVPLRRSLVGGEVIIRAADIARGRQYFDLSRRG